MKVFEKICNMTRTGFYQHWQEIYQLLSLHPREIPVDYLLEEYNYPNPKYSSLLHLFTSHSEVDYGLLLVSYNKKVDINIVDSDGNSPLHKACERCNKKAVELLLERGANVNLLNNNGQSPLICLCYPFGEEKRCEIMDLLVVNGANINWQFGVSRVSVNPILYTLKRYYERYPIYKALYGEESLSNGMLLLVQKLLTSGTNPNFTNEKGVNALHLVCFRNDFDMAQILISNGCNYRAIDSEGKSPLDRVGKPLIKEKILRYIKFVECR